jgi:hypothetical protein
MQTCRIAPKSPDIATGDAKCDAALDGVADTAARAPNIATTDIRARIASFQFCEGAGMAIPST